MSSDELTALRNLIDALDEAERLGLRVTTPIKIAGSTKLTISLARTEQPFSGGYAWRAVL